MALNLEYVVYESCQIAHLTIKKFKWDFFVGNFKRLINFFCVSKSIRLISIMLQFFKKLHFSFKNKSIRKDFTSPDERNV